MKKDNRGLSLVELLVAITILAIVITPFLHSFATAARTNGKAKRMMRATSVAENLLEGMKPLTLEETVCDLSSGTVSWVNSSTGGSMELLINENLPADAEHLEYAAENASGEWKFVGHDSKVYYFALTGIEQDGVQYDASIKLDASDYYMGAEETTAKYNDEELVQLTGLDLNQDVLYVLTQPEEEKVVREFQDRSEEAGYSKERLNRDVQVVIRREEAMYVVDIEITYTDSVNNSLGEYIRSMQVYKNSEPVRNIYILYQPNYESISPIKDHFTITNDEKLSVGVYLIKQAGDTPSNMLRSEPAYRAEVTVSEKPAGGSPNEAAATTIFSNFSINLGAQKQGASDYGMTDQTKYTYVGPLGNENLELLTRKDILNQTSRDRIYYTEVKIYSQGAFDNTDSSFDDEELLATISNDAK